MDEKSKSASSLWKWRGCPDVMVAGRGSPKAHIMDEKSTSDSSIWKWREPKRGRSASSSSDDTAQEVPSGGADGHSTPMELDQPPPASVQGCPDVMVTGRGNPKMLSTPRLVLHNFYCTKLWRDIVKVHPSNWTDMRISVENLSILVATSDSIRQIEKWIDAVQEIWRRNFEDPHSLLEGMKIKLHELKPTFDPQHELPIWGPALRTDLVIGMCFIACFGRMLQLRYLPNSLSLLRDIVKIVAELLNENQLRVISMYADPKLDTFNDFTEQRLLRKVGSFPIKEARDVIWVLKNDVVPLLHSTMAMVTLGLERDPVGHAVGCLLQEGIIGCEEREFEHVNEMSVYELGEAADIKIPEVLQRLRYYKSPCSQDVLR